MSEHRLLDEIGYGTANCSEGSAAPAGGNALAVIRKLAGCTDNNTNSTDFAAATSLPRNTLTLPRNPCSSGTSCLLNDRPAMLLDATFYGDHFNLLMIFGAGDTRKNVAGLITAGPFDITGDVNVPLIVVGDFNSYEFTDGYVDVTGTTPLVLDPTTAAHSSDHDGQVLTIAIDRSFADDSEAPPQ